MELSRVQHLDLDMQGIKHKQGAQRGTGDESQNSTDFGNECF